MKIGQFVNESYLEIANDICIVSLFRGIFSQLHVRGFRELCHKNVTTQRVNKMLKNDRFCQTDSLYWGN